MRYCFQKRKNATKNVRWSRHRPDIAGNDFRTVSARCRIGDFKAPRKNLGFQNGKSTLTSRSAVQQTWPRKKSWRWWRGRESYPPPSPKQTDILLQQTTKKPVLLCDFCVQIRIRDRSRWTSITSMKRRASAMHIYTFSGKGMNEGTG